MNYKKIIIGAGLYGLFSALHCGRKGENILVLERESGAFLRATYVNQARVHMGYHYPRSFFTALKSKNYFERFIDDYSFCINNNFQQIYATSTKLSWTDASSFIKFCNAADIPCESLPPEKYFNPGSCDGAFLTEEYSYDAEILRYYFLNELKKYPNVTIIYDSILSKIEKNEREYHLTTSNGDFSTGFLLNTTYASTNQIISMLGFKPFKIKYELCEIILCKTDEALKNTGITVMDGPFFSLMPFGKTGLHSLTSVTFTPHITSYDIHPTFHCQKKSQGYCSPQNLGNCNLCKEKPSSAWPYMSNMAKKYLKNTFSFTYESSLFSMKPILTHSELDDSRPTVIRKFSDNPVFISVLSGKINTVYDLEEVLNND